MMNALLIDSKDNVAVVTCPVGQGEQINFMDGSTMRQVEALSAIPVYHKIAVCDIPGGCRIIKYGHVIGQATRDIRLGGHVHCHNVMSFEEKGQE